MNTMLHSTCFWGIIACAVLSLLPYRLDRRWKAWPLYLPAAGLAFLVLYWCPVMEGVNAQADMRLILPLMLFVWVNGMVKVGLAWIVETLQANNPAGVMALPQRSIQLALGLSLLLGGAPLF